MIWEEMKESLIFLNLEDAYSGEVLKTVGTALIREGYAKSTYVNGLIEREKKFPTGLNIGGIGIAIPHTEACYVEKDGMALAVLKTPVKFFQMGTDDENIDVRLVFMLAIKDPDKHLKRLQRILDLIQDSSVLEQLLDAKDEKTIIRIIRKKEEAL